jgi:hypothetical protein
MRDVHVVPFWNTEMASLSVVSGSSVQRLEKLPLLVEAHVGALEIPDEDLM